jgi:hypothetical protein
LKSNSNKAYCEDVADNDVIAARKFFAGECAFRMPALRPLRGVLGGIAAAMLSRKNESSSPKLDKISAEINIGYAKPSRLYSHCGHRRSKPYRRSIK